MACGAATVTTNVAGLADLPALKCEPTPDALAAALSDAWPRRESLAHEQRELVTSVYNLDNWKDAWMGVLDGLAGR